MGFTFSLATVLRVRELAAEAEERALTRIVAELEGLRGALVRTDAELREAAQAREQVFTAAPLAAMHLHSSYAAAEALRARRGMIEKQIATFEELRTQQAARYGEAYRHREVLASLRDRARDAWSREQNKREEKAADEAFLNKRLREMRSERTE